MKLVILESPYAASEQFSVEQNITYARRCLKDSLLRGEAPIASHLLYTQEGVLDDLVDSERLLGIDAGLSWRKVANHSVVYIDHGISEGMNYGIKLMQSEGKEIVYRSLENY